MQLLELGSGEHTITSHKNFGYPSPPMEGSHGGGPCHSVLQSTLSLHLTLVASFGFSFRLEERGFVSDSANKIFSLYLVTMDIE